VAEETRREGGEDAAAKVLAARARRLAVPTQRDREPPVPALTFEVGTERYALPLDGVVRVERLRAVARLPGGQMGLVAVDGRPCPLVDLPAFLGQGGGAPLERRWVIVLGRASPELALAADGVDLTALPREALTGGVAPRIGVTEDARVVVDAAALLAEGREGQP
jgi:hypothetical protein